MTFFARYAYSIGCGFAACLWPFFRKRQKIAIENILRAKITDDPREARRIAKKSWCHLAGHISEALHVPCVITRDNWRAHLDTTGVPPETARLLLDSPDQPIILVSAHHGVWEAATNLLSWARPMIAIARVMNNKFVARWMKNHHFRGPVTVIDKKHGFTSAILQQWEREKSALTILMDQHAGKHGEMLTFLGRPAVTFTTATRLAMRSGHPIVVGSFVRLAPYRYRLVGGPPLRFQKTDDRLRFTQLLNDRLGDAIRQYPEQYLWAHRRWRDD